MRLPTWEETLDEARVALENLNADPAEGAEYNKLLMRDALAMFRENSNGHFVLDESLVAKFDSNHESGLGMFMIELLTNIDFADFGTSIRGSWLEPRGLAARELFGLEAVP